VDVLSEGLVYDSGMPETDTLSWLLDQLPETELKRRLEQVDAEITARIGVRDVLRTALRAREMAAEAQRRPNVPGAQFNEQLSALAESASKAAEAVFRTSNGSQPSGTEAIRILLSEAPQHTMTAQEIMEGLELRGWLPRSKNPRKAVGATLSRMVHRSEELEHVGFATYRLKPEPPLTMT
jgi:hypothetical protein